MQLPSDLALHRYRGPSQIFEWVLHQDHFTIDYNERIATGISMLLFQIFHRMWYKDASQRVIALLKAGSNLHLNAIGPEHNTYSGYTPLHCALFIWWAARRRGITSVEASCTSVILALLRAGARRHDIANDGTTPLTVLTDGMAYERSRSGLNEGPAAGALAQWVQLLADAGIDVALYCREEQEIQRASQRSAHLPYNLRFECGAGDRPPRILMKFSGDFDEKFSSFIAWRFRAFSPRHEKPKSHWYFQNLFFFLNHVKSIPTFLVLLFGTVLIFYIFFRALHFGSTLI